MPRARSSASSPSSRAASPRPALLIGFAIALRLSIDNLVGPLVLGEAARIHPVVVIISFVCGAILFGVVGLLIAVPVAVCIKITLEHYYAEPVAPTE